MKKFGLFLVAAALGVAGCSKSSDSAPAASSSNVINQVYSNLQSATPNFSSSSFVPSSIATRTVNLLGSIGSNLSTANVFPGIDSPGSLTSTGVAFFGDLYGSTAQNSVFWRAKMPFLISCTIDTLATRSGTLYDTSQTTVTMTSAVVGPCGTASDYEGPSGSLVGSSVTMTIANLSDTTYYDQFITMPGASNPQFGGNDQWIYIRNNSTTLNFMHVESNSGDTLYTINTLHFDKSTGNGFYQYTSVSTSSQFVYRIVMNKVDNKARIFTFWKMTNAPAHTILALVGSNYTSQTSAAMSLSVTGLGSSTSFDDGNACIDLSGATPSITTDNTLTCGSQTLSSAVGAVSGHAIATAAAALSGAAVRAWASTPATGATKYPSFDDTTIVSASLGL